MAGLSDFVKYLRQRNRDRLAKHRARKRAKNRGSFAVLAIMKNEAMNIDEWISHYLDVGADRIILIDNGSTDNTYQKAESWARSGKVDLVCLPAKHKQASHYWSALRKFAFRKYDWLLVADLDEFWFCPDGKTISAKLAEEQFDRIDVIYANWQMFGSSGFVDQPSSVRKDFVYRSQGFASHTITKYVCRTKALKSHRNLGIHKIIGADSAKTVSDNHNFHLFHYPIQSLEFFQKVKMTRGDANSAQTEHVRDMEYFRIYDAPCTKIDRTLADLIESGRLGRG